MDMFKILETLSQREDSISNLRGLQRKIFSNPPRLSKLFPTHWKIFYTCDFSRVSGDFYVCNETSIDKTIIVADSLGHGLEGAAASLGLYMAFRIALTEKSGVPSDILIHVNDTLMRYFDKNIYCDASVLRVIKEENVFEYSGSSRKAYFIKDGEVEVLKSYNKGLGEEENGNYTPLTVIKEYSPGDKVCLSTDGFEDQIGGPDNKRMTSKRVIKLLSDYANVSIFKQKEIMEKALMNWKGNNRFTDDILMLCFEP